MSPPLPIRRLVALGTAVTATVALAGCGADVRSANKGTGEVTVKRCGEPVPYTVPRTSSSASASPTTYSVM
jgi:iron complex transport system substrate-binding protein